MNLCERFVKEGVWVTNERTGSRCLTVIKADFELKATEPLMARKEQAHLFT